MSEKSQPREPTGSAAGRPTRSTVPPEQQAGLGHAWRGPLAGLAAWATVPGRHVKDERGEGRLWVGEVPAENRTKNRTLGLWARLWQSHQIAM